ncbi:MAG: anti-sigma factor family protein, partial [Planctomycetota bacterium]
MACQDYRALIPRYVDGELPPEQARLLKDHLPACDSCRGTVRLLRMEDRAIRGALLGAGSRGAVPRPPVRLVRAALICGILLGVATVALYGTYRGLAEKVEAARQNQAADLSRTLRVQADGIPLGELLEQISGRTGVE